MEDLEKLKRLDNDKLLDVVKNYQRYGYDEEIRNAAIALLQEKGWSMEELKMFGYLNNHNYDDALKAFKSFCRNVKLAYAVLFLSLFTLSIVYAFFIHLAYRNQKQFYRALGREEENSFMSDIFGIMGYFHRRNRMKEQLQGIS